MKTRVIALLLCLCVALAAYVLFAQEPEEAKYCARLSVTVVLKNDDDEAAFHSGLEAVLQQFRDTASIKAEWYPATKNWWRKKQLAGDKKDRPLRPNARRSTLILRVNTPHKLSTILSLFGALAPVLSSPLVEQGSENKYAERNKVFLQVSKLPIPIDH